MSSKIFHSKAYKVIMNYVYGWGACAVIVGALFKIMHFRGGGIVLSVGMIVEALIFFLSAFEPQPEHYNWSKVFPELSDDLGEGEGERGIAGSRPNMGMNTQLVDEDDAKRIKEGISKLTQTVEGISDISNAVAATDKYANSVNAVSDAMNDLKDKSGVVVQNLEASVETYKSVSDNLIETGNMFNEKISNQINELTQKIETSGMEFERLGSLVGDYAGFVKQFEGKYNGTASNLAENMGALNALYEMQLKGANEYMDKFSGIQKNISEMADNISLTLDNTRMHKNESEALGKNISSLNTVYGNMLSVLNNGNK